jgi:hypothetical protein
MFEFNDKTHVHTMWFVAAPKLGCDILGALYRDGDDPWKARYRFHYDADDSRSEYTLVADGKTVDEMATVMTVVMQQAADMAEGEVYTIKIDGGWEKVLSLLSEQPWFRVHREGMARA